MSGVNHCHSLQFDSRQSENVVYKQSESLLSSAMSEVVVAGSSKGHASDTYTAHWHGVWLRPACCADVLYDVCWCTSKYDELWCMCHFNNLTSYWQLDTCDDIVLCLMWRYLAFDGSIVDSRTGRWSNIDSTDASTQYTQIHTKSHHRRWIYPVRAALTIITTTAN